MKYGSWRVQQEPEGPLAFLLRGPSRRSWGDESVPARPREMCKACHLCFTKHVLRPQQDALPLVKLVPAKMSKRARNVWRFDVRDLAVLELTCNPREATRRLRSFHSGGCYSRNCGKDHQIKMDKKNVSKEDPQVLRWKFRPVVST